MPLDGERIHAFSATLWPSGLVATDMFMRAPTIVSAFEGFTPIVIFGEFGRSQFITWTTWISRGIDFARRVKRSLSTGLSSIPPVGPMVSMFSIFTRSTFFLNTPNPEYYLARRDGFLAGEQVAVLRYDGYGARSFFDELVCAMRATACDSLPIIEALEAFVGGATKSRGITASSYKCDEARLGL